MTRAPKPSERRKDRRVKQWNKTTVTPLEGGLGLRGAAESQAFTYDLSLCGAQVHAPDAFAVGTAVRLRILLARTMDSVKLEGRVVWVKRHPQESGYQMGVEFFHETPQGFLTLMKELFDGSPAAAAKGGPAAVSRHG